MNGRERLGSMGKVRLTAAQALIRYLSNQFIELDGAEVPYFAGVWAIFGHGNVAGLGEALEAAGDALPTFRAHNEQAMAHAAIAFAKAMKRRRAMACTTSIGPGALNMVTAAGVAHTNRLPVLLLPGDVFAGRAPDPVLQQVEDFGDSTVSANDCFRPVSRYFDRIQRPEQLIDCAPRAVATMLDPAACGPVTLAFCQDAQTEAYDYPASMFERRVWRIRRPPPDPADLDALETALRAARAPLLIAGGGVIYSGAEAALVRLAERTGVPVAETQAGKGALPWDHPAALGAVGVTGTSAANAAAVAADLVIGVGARLGDFTTGSRALFSRPGVTLAQINVAPYDAAKQGALAVVGDARATLEALAGRLGDHRTPPDWTETCRAGARGWDKAWAVATAAPSANELPSDGQVIGAVWRSAPADAVVVCAAGGLPGELHKLWRPKRSGGYHLEYGFSCMGYEIAGGLGVKLADPSREVIVMVGDGSYLMMNSEIATSVMLGLKLVIVVLDNRGFACINRLQRQVGGAPFNNLFADARAAAPPEIDFAAHAASLGATSEKADGVAALEAAMGRALASKRTYVVVIDTDPDKVTEAGGAWWDVPTPEVSARQAVAAARAAYEEKLEGRNA
jgi:3D-(3,5/4)-trihydroxycyclohexane-1,2-dione acylhydrolase (decyclizing)